MGGDKQTNKHTDRSDRHINTMTGPGQGAGPSENGLCGLQWVKTNSNILMCIMWVFPEGGSVAAAVSLSDM